MKILGIIAEYNPFHNGHAFHIREALKISNCDAAVIVGAEIAYSATLDGAAFWPAYALNAFTVGLGEAIACYVLGTLLLRALERTPALRRAAT